MSEATEQIARQFANAKINKINWGYMINAKVEGAIGDNVHDDTLPIQRAIDRAVAAGGTVLIPPGTYKMTAGITIPGPITILMDPMAQMNFTLTDNTQIAIDISYTPANGNGHYEFGKISGNNIGTGIRLHDSSITHVYFNIVEYFNLGFHMHSSSGKCLDNTIKFEFMRNCNTGIKLETDSPSYSIEGNRFWFNFMTEFQYGFVMQRDAGAIVYNELNCVAMHGTVTGGGSAIWSGGTGGDGNGPGANYFKVSGFFAHDAGLLISGDRVIRGENFYRGDRNQFDLNLQAFGQKYIFLSGGSNFIRAIGSVQDTHNADTGITPQTASNSEASAGYVARMTNRVLVRLEVPPNTVGQIISRYIYHQFCLNGWGKAVKIIPVSAYAHVFAVTAFDNSAAVNREIRIDIAYIQTTEVPFTYDFFVEFD